jgi:hypothetical protein
MRTRPFLVALVLPFVAGWVSAQPAFEFADGTAAPGESIAIALSITTGEEGPNFWSAAIAYDPAAFGNVELEPAGREVDSFYVHSPDTFLDPGRIGVEVMPSLYDDPERYLLGFTTEVVAYLHFCVLRTAPAGRFTIDFVPRAPLKPHGVGSGVSTYYHTVYGGRLDAATRGGEIAIEGATLPESECVPDQHTEPVVPAASFSLAGPSQVTSGSRFSVSLRTTTNLPLHFLSSAIRHGSEVLLESVAVNRSWIADNSAPVVSVSGDTVGISFATDLEGENALMPPGEDQEVAELTFVARSETAGSSASIDFAERIQHAALTQAGEETFLVFANRVGFARGINVDPGTSLELSVTVLDGALVPIVPAAEFRRGDANLDSEVNITDSLATLNFLFLGPSGSLCLDAADTDDSGSVNITDPIRTLGFLFLGGTEIPAPGPEEAGPDPTPDALSCIEDSGL